MKATNFVIFEGFIGNLPELSHTPSGKPYRRIWVINRDKYKAKDGSEKENVAEANTTLWGKQAENFTGTKGDRVMIRGSLRTNEYNNKKYLEIITDLIDISWKNPKNQPMRPQGKQAPPPDDDNLPF